MCSTIFRPCGIELARALSFYSRGEEGRGNGPGNENYDEV